MFELRKGDIFQSGCEAICNAVNCIGIMGAGLAYAFKSRYPQMNKDYVKFCKEGKLKPGIMHVWENAHSPKYIINFPTKDDLSPSKIEYIIEGLATLRSEVKNRNIQSIALPALGAGLGGLSWSEVKPLIEEWAKTLPNTLVIAYEPWEKR